MEWARIQGILIVRLRGRENWGSWEEIYALFNFVKSQLSMEPISVRLLNLTKNAMTFELYGVYRAEMFESLKRRLQELVENLKRQYDVDFAWIVGG